MTPSGDGTVNIRVRAYARRRADAPRQLDSWNALDLNGKMQRGPLKSMGPEAESYTRLLRGCYCDLSVATNSGLCNTREQCDKLCSTDQDCPSGSACINNPAYVAACGGFICARFRECTSSVTKRDLFGFDARDFGGRRMRKRMTVHDQEVGTVGQEENNGRIALR